MSNNNTIRIPQPPSVSSASSSAVSSRKNSFSSSNARKSASSSSTLLKEVSTNNNCNSTSFVPEAAKKAASEYFSYLKKESEQEQERKTFISKIHETLRDCLKLSRKGSFEDAVKKIEDVSLMISSSSTTVMNKTSSDEVRSARFALALSSPMIYCGCFPPRFDEAKMKIVEAYSLTASDTEIEQTEYNMKVVEALEEKFKASNGKMKKNDWFVDKKSENDDTDDEDQEYLVDLFYTAAPADEDNNSDEIISENTTVNQQEEEHGTIATEEKVINNSTRNNKATISLPSALSVSPPRHVNPTPTPTDDKNDDNQISRSKKSTVAINVPFVNILPFSASGSSSFSSLKRNLISLDDLLTNQNGGINAPCCNLCILRSLTFSILSLQKLNRLHDSVSWSQIFVVKQKALSSVLSESNHQLLSCLSPPSCCSIPFHNVIWFGAMKDDGRGKTTASSREAIFEVITKIASTLSSSSSDEQRSKIEEYLSKKRSAETTTMATNNNNCIDNEFFTFLASRPNVDASHQAPRKKKTANNNKNRRTNKSSASTLSFLDSFDLFIQPATQLALKEKGTLHLRLARDFLFSGVIHFFSSLQLEQEQRQDYHHQDENDEQQNHQRYLLLRPLAVTFQGESGVDACLGGLTNDMLQRFCEKFEESWLLQFTPSNNTSVSVEEVESEFGDVSLRAMTFGRVLAKCCLEKRRVAMKYWKFFCRVCVSGDDVSGFLEDHDVEDFNSSSSSSTSDNHFFISQVIHLLGGDKKKVADEANKDAKKAHTDNIHYHQVIELPTAVEVDNSNSNNDKENNNNSSNWTTTITLNMMSSSESTENDNNNNNNNNNIHAADLEDIELFESKPTSTTRSASRRRRHQICDLLKKHSEVLESMRRGFAEFISTALPETLSKFLVRKSNKDDDETSQDILELTTKQMSSPNDDDGDDTDCNEEKETSFTFYQRASHVISSLCFAGSSAAHSSTSVNSSDNNDELTGKEVVQVLEFRGWTKQKTYEDTALSSATPSTSTNTTIDDSSTPYYLCCWLHYQATPEMRKKFLRFTTCVPHISPELAESRIIIRRDDDRLFARTCLRTLHLPSFKTLQDLQESLETAIFVAENIDQEMHE